MLAQGSVGRHARHRDLTVDLTADPGCGDSVFSPAHEQLPVAQRTKVTLTPARTDDVRVHLGPARTGLDTFDLGSVPASVTPPRSWRRAAWFATASSGGVVVALLFAGSALVGKPPSNPAGGGWVPDLGGGQPVVGGEQVAAAPGVPVTDAEVAEKTGAPLSPGGPTRSARVRIVQGSSDVVGGAPASPGAATPAVSRVLQKPPSTPAPYDADAFQVGWPSGEPDMFAAESQNFLDTVTENPEAAHRMTTGALEREGSSGLARKYAGIAYFQVRHVRVHQYEGKTVCTVQAVYKDGTQTTEQRELTFAHGKINSAE